MASFWWQVLLRGIWDSLYGIGQSVEGVLYALTAVGFAAYFVFKRQGLRAMKRHLWRTVAEVLLVGVGAWLPFFLYHVLKAPYEMWSEEVANVRAADKKTADVQVQLNEALEKQKEGLNRLVVREQLGKLLAEGKRLQDNPAQNLRAQERAFKLWSERTQRYLRENLEPSYAVRFNAVDYEGNPIYIRVNSGMVMLQQFLSELKD